MPDILQEHGASTYSWQEASAPLQTGIFVVLLDWVCFAGAFMSPDGQKALIAGKSLS